MNRWKRAVIWSFTFGFGLIWVLAFFLPSEVGGGLDRHGMYAPDLVGTRLFYTSGSRQSPGNLSEHTVGAFIAMLDLDNTSVRREMIVPSPFRQHDYYGAKRPHVFRLGDRYIALYLGIGRDDKRRVCVATSADGTDWSPSDRPAFEVPATVSPDGPTWMTARQTPRGIEVLFLAQSEGRAIVRRASGPDAAHLALEEQPALALPPPESVVAVAFDGPRWFVLSQIGTGDPVLWTARVQGGRPVGARRFLGGSAAAAQELGLDVSPAVIAPTFAKRVTDVHAVRDGERLRLLVVGGDDSSDGDGRLRVALYEGRSLEDLKLAQNSQPDGSVVALGSPAFDTQFHRLAAQASDFVPILLNFGFGMGLISLIGIHGRRVARRGEGMFFSLALLLALVAMVYTQFGYLQNPESDYWNQLNNLLFFNMNFPLGSMMFGLLAAYLVSAAYRAFRIRSIEAAVLTAMAALVVLTQVPTGQFVGSLFSNEAVQVGADVDAAAGHARTWALTVINDAVQRGVGFGAFVGAIAMSLRIWLSLDKSGDD